MLRVSPKTMPIANPSDSKDDPPYETNGKVMPLVGIKLSVDAILTSACMPNCASNPDTASKVNRFLSLVKSL